MPTPSKKRVLSGMRPTGKLHLGNLAGALENWIALQASHECFYFVADWHMLTTDYADTSELESNIQEMVTDWLAAGLDPAQCTLFIQSHIPEHAELFLLLSMITPLGWLERVPTYKEQLENVRDKDLNMYGFLGYPVLQAADILIYKADAVPVGEDQVAHVELTREIARRFNLAFGRVTGADDVIHEGKTYRRQSLEGKAELIQRGLVSGVEGVLSEPAVLLTSSPRLPGTDGRKMSKSYGNAIYLSDPPSVVSKKLATMITDPARKRRTDPGNPDVCPVFDLHKVFSKPLEIDRINRECRTAEIGCLECKAILAANVSARLEPIQERRRAYEQAPQKVWDILNEGTKRAREVAQTTMAEVRKAMTLT